ncbi:MAG: CoA-binding protein [Candidatus Scalindua rubra]|uniref:CoA-binding protein n=1 Tax=Candidatus Scalindua rubra TaxID=1872076 RepID=A0A1E3X2U6_9BACT|nr:MAG: CoA-binding protein [Candidatus Scalindua rubra]
MSKESLRYLNNAKEILKKSPIEDNRYADVKYVKEACDTAYLAILKAIDEYLQNKGLVKKELPRSVDAYRKALRKYLAVHNGKLLRKFEDLYDELHIAGYYRGDLHHVKVVKEALNAAKAFIERIR